MKKLLESLLNFIGAIATIICVTGIIGFGLMSGAMLFLSLLH